MSTVWKEKFNSCSFCSSKIPSMRILARLWENINRFLVNLLSLMGTNLYEIHQSPLLCGRPCWTSNLLYVLTSPPSSSAGLCAGEPALPADLHGSRGRERERRDWDRRVLAGERGEGDHHGVPGPSAQVPPAEKPGGGGRPRCCPGNHLNHIWCTHL